MTNILPCPNPKCVCRLCRSRWEAWGIPPVTHWQVACEGCGYHGPWATSEERAIALHNGIAREEEWTSIERGFPEPDSKKLYDITGKTEGERYVIESVTRTEDSWCMGGTVRVMSDQYGGVTHFRPHTPPKPPEES